MFFKGQVWLRSSTLKGRDDSSQASTERAWILPIPIEGLQLCKLHMITKKVVLFSVLSESRWWVGLVFEKLETWTPNKLWLLSFCSTTQYTTLFAIIKFDHFLHLLIVNLAQGQKLAGQNWVKGFFVIFPWFPVCYHYVPFKFPMGSQRVPQHVLHSTSLLSHMLCQILSVGQRGVTLYFKIKPSILGSLHSFIFWEWWANQIGLFLKSFTLVIKWYII